MISREDCIALSGLDAKQVGAIAQHEHLPEVAATALASYLLTKPGGEKKITRMIVDDLRAAVSEGRDERAKELFMALREFASHHPEVASDLKREVVRNFPTS